MKASELCKHAGSPWCLVPVTIILTLQRGWMFKIRLMYRKEEYHQVPGSLQEEVTWVPGTAAVLQPDRLSESF